MNKKTNLPQRYNNLLIKDKANKLTSELSFEDFKIRWYLGVKSFTPQFVFAFKKNYTKPYSKDNLIFLPKDVGFQMCGNLNKAGIGSNSQITTKAKQSAKIYSEESRQKISDSLKKPKTPEHKEKMRLAALKRWAIKKGEVLPPPL